MDAPSAGVDPLQEAEKALWAVVKCLADTLWYIEHEPTTFGEGSTRSDELGAGLAACFAKLEAALAAVPDYSAEVGDKAAYDAKLASLHAQRAAMLPRLRAALARKEARLAEVQDTLKKASQQFAGLDSGR